MTPHAAHKLLKNTLLLTLSKAGFFVWANESGRLWTEGGNMISFGLPGSSDILGIAAPCGVMLAIECKTGRGKLGEKQKAFREQINQHGGIFHAVYWTHPDHFDVRIIAKQAADDIRDKVEQVCNRSYIGIGEPG